MGGADESLAISEAATPTLYSLYQFGDTDAAEAAFRLYFRGRLPEQIREAASVRSGLLRRGDRPKAERLRRLS